MSHIEPFKGILYNPKKVGISKVVAPPYDIIPPQMQDKLYMADPHNIVRLILGKETPADSDLNNKYTRARKFLTDWLAEEVLVADESPSIYVYSQDYRSAGKRKVQLGFIARMKLEDASKSSVKPHENTFPKPKQDRLNLTRQVHANLSCIYTLFDDKGSLAGKVLKKVSRDKPLFDFKFDDVRHKMWKLKDPGLIKKLQGAVENKEVFIADGHHRYEVARMYRDEMREKEGRGTRDEGRGYEYVMTYFTPIDEKRLTILATHRIVKNIYADRDGFIEKLNEFFYVKPVNSLKALLDQMGDGDKKGYLFGIYFKNRKFYLLKLKNEKVLDAVIDENVSKEWKRLDVSILHGIIFNHILGLKDKVKDEDNIIYTRDPAYAKKEIDKDGFDAAFFLNPTKAKQVRDIAEIGDKMPHKSTYFYPKLVSGLVINKLDGEK